MGGAQSLAAVGASLVEMQFAGRWHSPVMPVHYAQEKLAGRGPLRGFATAVDKQAVSTRRPASGFRFYP